MWLLSAAMAATRQPDICFPEKSGLACSSAALLNSRCSLIKQPGMYHVVVIYKDPKEIKPGQMPYGRISHDEAMRTLTTKTCQLSAGLSCLHPTQPRVPSVREVSRAQVRMQGE